MRYSGAENGEGHTRKYDGTSTTLVYGEKVTSKLLIEFVVKLTIAPKKGA